MKYFEVAEVSQKLNLSENTVRKYIREGKIKAVKAGKRYIVSENNYNNFIDGKNEVQKWEIS